MQSSETCNANQTVKQHYSEVARNAATGCCDLTTGEALGLYSGSDLEGIPAEALAASRGCGDPVAKAALHPGERVLDLGSGGGIDALIAARAVGAEGHVYGLDMTAAMAELARRKRRRGHIELRHQLLREQGRRVRRSAARTCPRRAHRGFRHRSLQARTTCRKRCPLRSNRVQKRHRERTRLRAHAARMRFRPRIHRTENPLHKRSVARKSPAQRAHACL